MRLHWGGIRGTWLESKPIHLVKAKEGSGRKVNGPSARRWRVAAPGLDSSSTSFPRQCCYTDGLSAPVRVIGAVPGAPAAEGSSVGARAALSSFGCPFTVVFYNPVFLGPICSSSSKREGKIFIRITNVSFNQHHLTLWELNFYLSPHTLNMGLYLFVQNWFAHNSLLWPLSCKSWHFSPMDCRKSNLQKQIRGENPVSPTSCCWVLCLSVCQYPSTLFLSKFPLWGCSQASCAFWRWNLDRRFGGYGVGAGPMAFVQSGDLSHGDLQLLQCGPVMAG